MMFSGSFLMFLEAQTRWAYKFFFLNWLGVWCYPPVALLQTNKTNFSLCSVLAAWRVTPNTDLFLKKILLPISKPRMWLLISEVELFIRPPVKKNPGKKCF